MAKKTKKTKLRTTKAAAIQDILEDGVTNYRGKTVKSARARTQAQALEAIERKFPEGLPRGPYPQA